MPKVVFSRTLERAPWGKWDNARVSKSSPADEVRKLKQESGKDMVLWGSLSVAQSLMDEGMIDEYQLIVCPVVLGSGRPLFGDRIDALNMQLLDTRSFDRGAVLLSYATANVKAATATR